MKIPTTGIVFLYGAFVLFFISYRFLRLYKKTKNIFSQLFSIAFLSFGFGFLTVGGMYLLLIKDEFLWETLGKFFGGFNILGFGVLGITFFVITKPKAKELFMILFSILTLLSLLFSPPPPHLYKNGTITWEEKEMGKLSLFGKICFFILALSSIVPTAIYFLFHARKSKEEKARKRTFIWGISLLLATIVLLIMGSALLKISFHPVLGDFFIFLFLTSLLLVFL